MKRPRCSNCGTILKRLYEKVKDRNAKAKFYWKPRVWYCPYCVWVTRYDIELPFSKEMSEVVDKIAKEKGMSKSQVITSALFEIHEKEGIEKFGREEWEKMRERSMEINK